MQTVIHATETIFLYNIASYLLAIILMEWIVSNLVNRGLARWFGVNFAQLYNRDITFLGVIHHELSHAILALLSGASIQKICLYRMPWSRKKKEYGLTEDCLGYVTYSCRGIFLFPQIQDMLTGVAPALLGSGTVILCGLHLWNGWQMVRWRLFANPRTYLVSFLMISVAHHACPSSRDMKNSRAGLIILFLAGILYPVPLDIANLLQHILIVIIAAFVLPSLPFMLGLLIPRSGKTSVQNQTQ